MFKRLALGAAVIIISLGVIFIVLNILDIAEDYRLYWPIAVLNTVFIGVITVFVTYFAISNFMSSGSPEMLGLSCVFFSFGCGIFLYGWLDADLNTRIAAHDTGILITAVAFAVGAGLKIAGRNYAKTRLWMKSAILLIAYLVIIAIIGIITWLASQESISFLNTVAVGIGLRTITKGIAIILFSALAIIYIKTYLESHSDMYYWFSLGLILLAGGVFFASEGPLESSVVWLGRFSEYAGSLYFLFSALDVYRRRRAGHINPGEKT